MARRAVRYVTYQINDTTNAAAYHAGIGRTPEEAQSNARYWRDQFTRTVPAGRAPGWAAEEAIEALRVPCQACEGPRHTGVCVDPRGYVLPAYRKAAEDWQREGYPARFADGEMA